MPLTNDILLQNYRGAVGKKFVLRMYNGRTFTSRYPYFANGHAPTPGQRTRRLKFKEAVIFAQAVLRDPELKAYYASFAKPPHSSAYHKAVSDACTEPEILRLDSCEYKGSPGLVLQVVAIDLPGNEAILNQLLPQHL